MNDPAKVIDQAWVQALLHEPLIARLGTANPRTMQPHVVPVWFEWDGEAMWVSAFSSTRKMRDLEANRRISILIDVAEDDGSARGILFEGKAEIISEPALVAPRSISIYQRYLGADGAREPEPASWAVDPENRLIRLVPERAYAWGG